MSGSTSRDVQMIIWARNETKQTLDQITASIAQLNVQLRAQAEAASQGQVGIKELEATLSALQRAEQAVLQQATGVERFKELSAQLAQQSTRALASREAYVSLAASLETVTRKSKEQRDALRAAKTAADGDERAANRTATALRKMTTELEAAGIAAGGLARAEQTLLTNTTELGRALGQSRSLVEGFSQQQAAIRATAAAKTDLETKTRKVADAETAFQASLQGGRNLLREIEYIKLFDLALDALDAKERQIAANRGLEEKARRDLAAFRKLAEGAAALDRGFATTARASPAVSIDSSVAATVERIVAPAAAARRELKGLQDQINTLVTGANTGGKSIQDYADILRGLEQAQRALVAQGGLVDQFRRQVAQVGASRQQFVQARESVRDYAAQVASAARVDDDLARSLANAQKQMHAAFAETQNGITRARELRAALEAQGISTRNLAGVEQQLLASATRLRPAMERLAQVVRSGVSPGGPPTLFGLRPYQLQNLGFQINDVFTQLASGTSITQTLAQQGGQILQIFPGAFTLLAKLAVPVLAAAAAVGVLTAALTRQFALQQQIRTFTAELRLSADGAIYNADAMLRSQQRLRDLGASFDEAGKAVSAFANAGINPQRIDQFAKTAQDLADVTGKKLTEVVKELTDAFTKDGEAIYKLNEQYNFLNDSQLKSLRQALDEGDIREAQRIAFNALRDSAGAAAEEMLGPWARATRQFTKDWNAMIDALANSRAGVAGANAITAAINLAARAMRELTSQSARVQIARATDGIASAQGRLALAQRALKDADQIGSVQGRARARQDAQRTIAEINAEIDGNFKLIESLNGAAAAERGAAAAAALGNSERTEINKSTSERTTRSDQQTAATRRQQAADDQILTRLRRERLARLSVKDATDAERKAKVDLAALEARERVQKEGGSIAAQESAAADARLAKQREIDNELNRMGSAAAARERARAEELTNYLHKLEAGNTKLFEGELTERLRTFDETIKRMMARFEDFRKSGAKAIEGIPIEEFRRRLEAAVESARRLETVKFLQETLKGLRTENEAFAKSLSEDLVAGTLTAADALARLNENAAITGPLMLKNAKATLEQVAAAEKLGKLSPALSLAKQQAQAIIAGNANTEGGVGTPEQNTIKILEGGLAAINRLVEIRKQTIIEQNALVEAGATTQIAAEEQIRLAYERTTKQIVQLSTELTKVAQKANETGSLGDAAFALWEARLKVVQAQAQYLSPAMKELQDAVKGAFPSEASTLFKSVIGDIVKAAAGTQSWATAFRNVQRAMLTFFANLLEKIAEAILQAQLLKAINSLFGGGGGFLGGLFGGGGDAAASATAGFGDVPFFVAHGGGTVGDPGGISRMGPSSWLANAPRMHSGAPGLSSDEMPAVLKRGEDVRTSSQREADERRMTGAGQQNMRFKVVVVDNPDRLGDYLQSPAGERVIVASIGKNARAVNGALSSG